MPWNYTEALARAECRTSAGLTRQRDNLQRPQRKRTQGCRCGLPARDREAARHPWRSPRISRRAAEARATGVSQRCRKDTMQLALARGHRWLAMLESGGAKSITKLAAREKIDNSYLCRMLNLTPLAPDIVAALLDATLPHHVTVHDLAITPRCCGRSNARGLLTQRQPDTTG